MTPVADLSLLQTRFPQLIADMLRIDQRSSDEIRPVKLTSGIAPNSSGSVLISVGNTQVICAATIEPGVPRWMIDQKVKGGWLTAEYSMLPYSTHTRKARDISKGKLDGRSSEIQRLIDRALRAVVRIWNSSVKILFGSIAMSFKRMVERVPPRLPEQPSRSHWLASRAVVRGTIEKESTPRNLSPQSASGLR